MSMSASCLNWWYMLGSLRVMCSGASLMCCFIHVISSQQFGRTPCVLVSLGVAPAFFLGVSGLRPVQLGNVVEHKSTSFAVAENASFAANSLGDQDAAYAWRPDHSGWVELDELHV